MNFFESQVQARKTTKVLVGYFILAIILILLAIWLVSLFAFALMMLPENANNTALLPLMKQHAWHMLGVSSMLTLGCILLCTIYRMSTLTSGGVAVAKLAGAEAVNMDTRDKLEQRFIHVVEEMSIASGIRIPKLYIMKNESVINAFVAGVKPQDTVMVVTQGALEKLNRQELQGVIGHEFSHIFNGDMLVSIRLIGFLAGILIIGQLGQVLLRTTAISRSGKRDGKSMLALLVLAIALTMIGYIGLFFGRLIKAAISRQRESLADACSVQYTRDPSGLIGALRKIDQNSKKAFLQETTHAEEISHLCFSSALRVSLSGLLNTHPPIAQRIKALDPNAKYLKNDLESKPPIKEQTQHTSEKSKKKTRFIQDLVLTAAVLTEQNKVNTQTLETSIGQLDEEHIAAAQNLLKEVDVEIKAMAHQPQHYDKVIYALMLSQQTPEVLSRYQTLVDAESFAQTQTTIDKLNDLNQHYYLAIFDLTQPTFANSAVREQQKIIHLCTELHKLCPENLLQFSLIAMLTKISKESSKKQEFINQEIRAPVVSQEISELLVFLLDKSTLNASSQQKIYALASAKFSQHPIEFLKVKLINQEKLQTILARLNLLRPSDKQKLIAACLLCIQSDSQVSVPEAQFMRVICALLDCPIPLILPTPLETE